MINIGNISSHVGSRMMKNYGFLFHPLASTDRDVRQTNALTHIDPEAQKHQETEAHGEKGQSLTPDHVRNFTDVFRPKKPDLAGSDGPERMTSESMAGRKKQPSRQANQSYFGGPGGPQPIHESAPVRPKNPTAPKK